MADVTVKLTVGSFSTEVTGPTEYVDKKVEELVTRFLTSWKPTTGDPAASAVPLAAGGKRTSAGEFIKQAKAKSQSDVTRLLHREDQRHSKFYVHGAFDFRQRRSKTPI
jgi:hypothetical protein